MDRRAFLKSFAGAGTLAAAGELATPALSQRAAARTVRSVMVVLPAASYSTAADEC